MTKESYTISDLNRPKHQLYKTKSAVLIFCLVSFYFHCFAQSDITLPQTSEQIDSIATYSDKKTLAKIGQTNPNLYAAIIQRRYEIAIKNNDTYKIVESLISIGNSNNMRGEYELSKKNLFEALHYVSLSPNTVQKATIFRRLGQTFEYQGEHLKALENFEKSLKLAESIKDRKEKVELKAKVHFAVINVYLRLEMTQEAKKTIMNTLNELETIDSPYLYAICQTELANIYLREEKSNMAIQYYLKAISLLDITKAGLIAEINGSLSQAYLQSKEYSSARSALQKTLSFYEENNLVNTASYNLNLILLAEINLAEKTNLESTIQMVESVLAISQEMNLEQLISYASDLLYRAYKMNGDLDLALEMKELSEVYAQKLDLAGKSEKLKIDAMRDKLRQEKEKNLASIKRYDKSQQKNRIKMQLILIFAGLFILSMSFIYLRKNRKYSKERKRLLAQLAQSNRRKESASNGTNGTKDVEVVLDEHRINELSSNKLNETDWKVIYTLKTEPSSTNKEIASRIHMSYDGVVSSLRKMYQLFSIEVKKNHKLELLVKLYKISETQMTE